MADLKNFLIFRLGDEEFAIDIGQVQEIRIYEEPTPMPSYPEFVTGVLDLRGVVVPIVDLRKRFGLDDAITNTTVIVVLNLELNEQKRTFGLVVDAVVDVYELDLSTIQKSTATGSMDARFILGLIRYENPQTQEGEMIVLIDVETLLSQGLSDEALEEDADAVKAAFEQSHGDDLVQDNQAPSIEEMKRRMMA